MIPTNDTKTEHGPLSPEVTSLMSRIKTHHAEMTKERPKSDAPNPERIVKQMLRNDYPERSLDRIETGMWGPGLTRAQALLPTILRGGTIIILHGDRGPGKTQMATWWAYQRALAGKSPGRYVKALNLLGELKSTWGNNAKISESQVMDRYRRTPFLVIDEMHERSLGEWENQVITNIVDHRYDAMLDTVLVGNFTREALPDVIPASIISRAEECGGTVFCEWPSYRAAQQEA